MEDKDYLQKLGDRIVEFRKEKGLKQIDLSFMVGIEDSALRRIEKGRVNTTINMLRRIAKELNISVSELLDF